MERKAVPALHLARVSVLETGGCAALKGVEGRRPRTCRVSQAQALFLTLCLTPMGLLELLSVIGVPGHVTGRGNAFFR